MEADNAHSWCCWFLLWHLHFYVVLRHISRLSVHLRLVPVVFSAYNLSRKHKKTCQTSHVNKMASVPKRESLCRTKRTNLKDVSLPEAELVVRRRIKIVLSSRFHRDWMKSRTTEKESGHGSSVSAEAERNTGLFLVQHKLRVCF